MSTTRIELLRDLADYLYRDRQDVATGIAGDHTVSSLTDAVDLKYSSGDSNTYDRKFVYLEALGEQSRVTEGGFAGTDGILTLSPNVTDAPTVPTGNATNVTTTATTLTDTDETMTVDAWIGYTVYAGGQTLDVTSNTATVLTGTGGWSYGGAGPGAVAWTVGTRYIIGDYRIQALRKVINQVLRNMYVPCFAPLSLFLCTSDDNDMETAPATSFSTGSSNVTLVNETTIAKNGGQSLAVVASAAAGYAHFGTVGVNENETLYAGIDCYVASGDSATFQIYDVTNSKGISPDATTDEPKWMSLVFPFTAPSGCEQIQARAICDANTDTAYWDDFHLWKSGEAVYELPAWITRPSQIIDIRAFPHGAGGPSSDNDYRTDERASYDLSWGLEREDIRANKPLLIWANCTSARPYIYALRPLSELAADSSTTTADKDKVVFWAEKLIREPEKATETLARLRALSLSRPVTRHTHRAGMTVR